MAIAAMKPAPVLKPGEITRERVEAFSAARHEDAAMLARRLEALRVLKDTPPPNRWDETWRRVDLGALKMDALLAAIPTDGGMARSTLTAGALPPGVVFGAFADVARQQPALLDRYFMTEQVKLSDGWLAALHGVFVDSGAVLFVPAGVSVEEPVRVQTVLDGAARAGFNHTLIVLEKGARATFIEEFRSEGPAGSDPALVNNAVEIRVGEGAQLDYVNIQDWGRNVWNFTTERAHTHAHSTLHWVMGGIGARFTKSAIEADLLGEHGVALLSGVYFADQRQQFHYDTQQNHVAAHCKSDLLYKSALRDDARTVWRGNIRVFRGAQKTDGYQANRNLQLSARSRADSIPGLEIEADDVRCTHGATVGQIEAEPVFYLRSRGIPEREARRLVVEGFFAPVIERIPLAETRDRLIEEIGRKIALD